MADTREAKMYNGVLRVWENKLRQIHMTLAQRNAMISSLIRQLKILGCDVTEECDE